MEITTSHPMEITKLAITKDSPIDTRTHRIAGDAARRLVCTGLVVCTTKILSFKRSQKEWPLSRWGRPTSLFFPLSPVSGDRT
jgi:hypothetical protein